MGFKVHDVVAVLARGSQTELPAFERGVQAVTEIGLIHRSLLHSLFRLPVGADDGAGIKRAPAPLQSFQLLAKGQLEQPAHSLRADAALSNARFWTFRPNHYPLSTGDSARP